MEDLSGVLAIISIGRQPNTSYTTKLRDMTFENTAGLLTVGYTYAVGS